ncbi:MAG: hypothetical protein AAB393_00460 [Bacteroidota bacterium]
MKAILYLFTFVTLVCCLCFCTASAQQQDQGNVFVVTTVERAFPEGGTRAELDSLTQLFTDRVIKKNELILSHRILRHWWGHDNTQVLIMYEVKDWADVDKANTRNDELFQKAFPTKEERDRYNKANGKYFSGKHADEIYSEVKAGRK